MKDEIKEILDILKDNIYVLLEDNREYKLLDKGDDKLLLDCITNLQEQLHQASLDIQELIEKDIGCPSWCDKLTNLQEENINCDKEYTKLIYKYNKLLEENKRLKENAIHNDKVVDKAKWNEMIYKSRNEKAIEILHSINEDLPLDLILTEIEHSEYVLQGEDKE